MKTYLECIPCFFRQALEASKLAGAKPHVQRHILNRVAHLLPSFPFHSSPPEMGQIIYRTVNKLTGQKDPYRIIKKKSNLKALSLYPKLRKKIATASDPLAIAVRLAIAGNIIDYGVKNTLNVERELKKILGIENLAIRRGMKKFYQYKKFRTTLQGSDTILYLADNAGESVFDRLLIEEIKQKGPQKKIFYAVKSGPTINDALAEDAIFCGLERTCKIITNGLAAPGTILKSCSPDFKRIFKQADMVISKGQGNFESLSEAPRPVFFLFMAKCPVVADHVGCHIGDIILKQGGAYELF